MPDHFSMYWRFASGLRDFLKDRITFDQCRDALAQRLQNREQNFLEAVTASIYRNANSPYLRLLRGVGCEYGDFDRMVLSDGIETALAKLCDVGVYVTLEEFKGNREIVRGSTSFRVEPGDFDAPLKSNILAIKSSATRSSGTRTAYDFEHLTLHAMSRCLTYRIAGADQFPLAMWWPTLPAGGPKQLLTSTKAGKVPVQWFAQVSKTGSGPTFRNRALTRYVVYAGRLCGVHWPAPKYTPLDRADDVANWMAKEIGRSGGCCLLTYTSSALRVCQAAKAAGLDMSGARFIVGGEPYTVAKRTEIESVGASCVSIYAFVEAGIVGVGCLHPRSADDTHLMTDSFALIPRRRNVQHSQSSVDSFLFTSILSSAPKVMLNTENGDYGVTYRSNCGCQLEELGLRTCVHTIRGFDKLTAEGMTLVGTDLLRVLEDVLPAKYGGSSSDYQIVEEEDERGRTRMSIIVSPGVGAINEAELIREVLDGLPRGSIAPAVWSEASTFRVKRASPIMTRGGKLMPLHIQRNIKR